MAYTIVKSDGTVLTTIADGTINTTSTSLGLVGRSYSGYGQAVDTNFVHQVENFASSIPPPNPLRGQLWYNTTNSTMYVCPSDGEANAAAWLALTSTASSGSTSFGEVSVSGSLSANNIVAINEISATDVATSSLTVTTQANISNAALSGTTTVASLNTTSITTGGQAVNGNIVGTWSLNGNGTANGVNGTALWITNGNLVVGGGTAGIRTDNYYFANGDPISFTGTYSNTNVQSYLPTYIGNVGNVGQATIFNGRTLTTGSSGTSGLITGTWTLTPGSSLQASYADLAERFEADAEYLPGTVVELGGEKEITIVKDDLSEKVFGVVSNTAAYMMNAGAGDNSTHPAIALAGRVSVRAVGKINKGDRLVSAGNGVARAANLGEANAFNTFGRSLIDKYSQDEGFIEAVVIIR